MNFNPNLTGSHKNGIFSLPFGLEESRLVLLPVPWDVTASYKGISSLGSQTIFTSSKQIDLWDELYGDFYKKGIFQLPINLEQEKIGLQLKEKALILRTCLENGQSLSLEDLQIQSEINKASNKLNQWVFESAKKILNNKQYCAVVGGDHSCPYGLIQALKEKYKNLSLLQIDAHMDLRKSYQGYHHSHASIMRNVIEDLYPKSLVQVGIRDFCPEEKEYGHTHSNIHTFFAPQLALDLAQGKTWGQVVEEILSFLTDRVYISFDIDGLQPHLCPHTGTPVPGGLSFEQIQVLLYKLSQSSKRIIGFDLCEVSPESPELLDSWDGNVGARVLFQLCGALLTTNP